MATLNPVSRKAVRAAIVFVLLASTVFQRFGLNLMGGGYALQLALVAIYVLIAVAGFSGQLTLSVERVLLYMACMCIATASLLINTNLADVNRSSLSSLLLLAVMYLPFVLVLRDEWATREHVDWVLEAFANIALFAALAGIVQFFSQFVLKAPWLFDFTPYLPDVIKGQGLFNPVIPVGSFYKSNGFFFREPSGFSFIMALAIILEVGLGRRWWRMACLGLALLLTYSGTGMLALLIGLMFPFGLKTAVRYVGVALVGFLVLWSFGDALNLSFTLSRVGEFNSEHSSGYIRYVAPLRLLNESIDHGAWTAWLGYGPGAIFRTFTSFEFHDPTWAKLIYEDGILGILAFIALFVSALNRARVPIAFRVTLFFNWLIMGGHLLSPEANHMALVLVGFLPAMGVTKMAREIHPRGAALGATSLLAPTT
jgi:hypothetical protein